MTAATLCLDCDHGVRGGVPCETCGGSGYWTDPRYAALVAALKVLVEEMRDEQTAPAGPWLDRVLDLLHQHREAP